MAFLVEIERVLGNLEPFVHAYGAAAVMVILTFESLGLPLPGESLLVFASVLERYPVRLVRILPL
jgi:membrane protein DedA with SNARE-associated domain